MGGKGSGCGTFDTRRKTKLAIYCEILEKGMT